MKIVYTGNEMKDEMIGRAVEDISRAERAYERNLALLLRCGGRDEEEAGKYASVIGKISLMAENAFMETAVIALSANREPHEVNTWKDGIPGEMGQDEYISMAMALSSADGYAEADTGRFRLERRRAGHIASMVFDAVSRIRREAYEIVKIDLLWKTNGNREAEERKENARRSHLMCIRSIFSTVCCSIRSFREYITALEEGMPVRECEDRMYAMMAARGCVWSVLGRREDKDREKEENDDAGKGCPDAYAVIHLVGDVEAFDTRRAAAGSLHKDLYHLAVLALDAEREFLFAGASDILMAIGEGKKFDKEEAEKISARLEEEADGRWHYPADNDIYMVLVSASDYIKDFAYTD